MQAQAGWAAYQALPIGLIEVDIGRAMALATERGLYAYDGYMLELSRSRALPLLTLDAKLGDAALRAGVELVGVWRRWLARLLDQARRESQVQIRRQDGSTFLLQPVVSATSPLKRVRRTKLTKPIAVSR